VINEAAPQAGTDPGAAAGAEAASAPAGAIVGGTTAALEQLFSGYHFPAGPGGHRRTPQQLGGSNAAAALRLAGGAIRGREEGTRS
jgi:hypothetical protein